jgi:TRAP-type C4-dicarboxylate transport system permease small subunit
MFTAALLFACVLLVIIAYCGFSRKSSRGVRIAAFISLFLVLASVLVCLIFVSGVFIAVDAGGQAALDLSSGGEVKAVSEIWFFVVFALFFLALLVLIIIAFIRERRKAKRGKDTLAA